jgi:serine/threonine protein phosphatase PrpC
MLPQVTADHAVRPIIVPRDVSALPWAAGYAETINAGKSRHNEDQAMARRGSVGVLVAGHATVHIPYTMFAVFDGHAGAPTAVTASNELWQAVQARLESVGPQLLAARQAGQPEPESEHPAWAPTRTVSEESLVIGALEAAFWETDQQIGEEKKVYSMAGGCTVLVALFILGKLYVANAGDSRAVLTRASRAYPMSYDFTPVSERQRLQTLGRLAPHLLGQEYTWLEYLRRPARRDIGSRMLYRDAHMTGWAYKVIQESDLKFPMVYGEGKRSRLLATIGVTRGFGDHELRAQAQQGSTILIKPFLTPQPEVRVLDVETETVTAEDVLVLATDGLWDVVSNEEVAAIVQRGLQAWDNESKAGKYRYISLAQVRPAVRQIGFV